MGFSFWKRRSHHQESKVSDDFKYSNDATVGTCQSIQVEGSPPAANGLGEISIRIVFDRKLDDSDFQSVNHTLSKLPNSLPSLPQETFLKIQVKPTQLKVTVNSLPLFLQVIYFLTAKFNLPTTIIGEIRKEITLYLDKRAPSYSSKYPYSLPEQFKNLLWFMMTESEMTRPHELAQIFPPEQQHAFLLFAVEAPSRFEATIYSRALSILKEDFNNKAGLQEAIAPLNQERQHKLLLSIGRELMAHSRFEEATQIFAYIPRNSKRYKEAIYYRSLSILEKDFNNEAGLQEAIALLNQVDDAPKGISFDIAWQRYLNELRSPKTIESKIKDLKAELEHRVHHCQPSNAFF